MDKRSRYHEVKKVTVVNAVVNSLLGVGKIIFGVTGHSQALIADGVHSISDLITDLLVLLAARFASQDADADHPYGHGRIETAASVALAMLLLLVAVGIVFDAVMDIGSAHRSPGWAVVIVALLSVFANEGLFQYTLNAGTRLDSKLLEANAWHSRSDAASSVVVLAGVLGSMLGYYFLDAVAAIIVSLMIMHMAFRIGWSSLRELVDTGLDEVALKQITDTIKGVEGVVTLHQLRSRSMAESVLLDVHIIVNSRLSVSEGHYVGEKVRATLIRTVNKVTDVTVHVDPEDDEAFAPSIKLPQRTVVLEALHERWGGLTGENAINEITLHYLDGKIHVDVSLPVSILANADDLQKLVESFRTKALAIDYVGSVNVLFSS